MRVPVDVLDCHVESSTGLAGDERKKLRVARRRWSSLGQRSIPVFWSAFLRVDDRWRIVL
jgi:hypothetical protein